MEPIGVLSTSELRSKVESNERIAIQQAVSVVTFGLAHWSGSVRLIEWSISGGPRILQFGPANRGGPLVRVCTAEGEMLAAHRFLISTNSPPEIYSPPQIHSDVRPDVEPHTAVELDVDGESVHCLAWVDEDRWSAAGFVHGKSVGLYVENLPIGPVSLGRVSDLTPFIDGRHQAIWPSSA